MIDQNRIKLNELKRTFARNHLKEIVMASVGIVLIFTGFQVALGTENPFYVVSSGSMAPVLGVYDVIMVQKNVPFEYTKVGDIIVFNSPSDQSEIIVHRAIQIINQEPFEIRTKGDANLESIPGIDLPITKDNYIGKVVYVIPQAGYLAAILIPPINYIIIASIFGIILVRPFYNQK